MGGNKRHTYRTAMVWEKEGEVSAARSARLAPVQGSENGNRCKQVTRCMKSSRNISQCARNRKLVRVISNSHTRVYRESIRKYRYYFLSPYFVLQPKATVGELWADMRASLHASKHVLKLAHTAT